MLQELESTKAKMEETRATLALVLDRISETQATELIVGGWSIKDTIAHLASAERGMTRLAQRFAAGENPKLPADYNNDVYNARQIEKRRALSFAQARAELDTAQTDLYALMESITLPQLEMRGEHPIWGFVTLKELLEIIVRHTSQHGKEISDQLGESKN